MNEMTTLETGQHEQPRLVDDNYLTHSRGLLSWILTLTPNDEVDDVVWVPLDYLMVQENREPLAWEWKGQNLETDSYLYESYRIWGLSLMMIDEMIALLKP